jgi:tRNA threonylcarbamoyl adenosine modification protein (Sua5/YciO/YrdC/YwlC family)
VILSINAQNPQMRLLRQVVDILERGGIIIYPTDTVYGIGCDLFNKKAVEKIYEIKRRDRKQPFSFVCSDLSDISKYAVVPTYAYKIMRHLLPGPYTFVMGASRMVPKTLLPRRREVGIRIPDNMICLTLVREFGRPVISTSVKNAAGEIMTDPEEMEEEFKHRVDCVIDGGVVGDELSSVVSLVEETPQVIRAAKGDVSFF